MPFCENCGNKISETSKFCMKCGFQLKPREIKAIINPDSSYESVITNPNEANASAVDASIMSYNTINDNLEEKVEIKKEKKPIYKTFLFWFWIVMAIFYYTSRIGWWGETMSGEGGRRLFIRIFVGVNALYFANKLRSNSKNK
jgi:uncharacterized membrane protein YvbJ